jgi:hypothetical protein
MGMNNGDSFFIPTLKPSPLIYSVEKAAKKEKVKVKTYACIKDDVLGVRVWKLA